MTHPDWLTRAENAARVLARYADDVDRNARWPAESLAAVAEAGLYGLTLSPEVGGGGQCPRTWAAVTCTLAEQCASTAMIYLMHTCAVRAIDAAVELPEGQQLLRDIVAGRHLSTLAFSEKGSRSHFWAPVSQAVADGTRHRLSASKSWVTSAGHADSYVVSTRSAGSSDPAAVTLYLVGRDASGLNTSGAWNGLGMRGNASAPMKLEGVTVPASARLSPEGKGMDVTMSVILPWFQLGTAAVSVGIARAAVAATRQHLLSSQFEHLGQPLTALLNLRARLGQMQTTVDVHAAFVNHVAEQMRNPGPDTLLALLEGKAAAAEAALQVTDLAMRTCGGAAFSRHLTVERNFRDARASSVMAPTTDVLHDFVAKTLLDMPLFG